MATPIVMLSRRKRMEIAVTCGCDERTVARVYAGRERTYEAAYQRIADAAKRLKLPAPPPRVIETPDTTEPQS